jgi:hypothetical protein
MSKSRWDKRSLSQTWMLGVAVFRQVGVVSRHTCVHTSSFCPTSPWALREVGGEGAVHEAFFFNHCEREPWVMLTHSLLAHQLGFSPGCLSNDLFLISHDRKLLSQFWLTCFSKTLFRSKVSSVREDVTVSWPHLSIVSGLCRINLENIKVLTCSEFSICSLIKFKITYFSGTFWKF